MNTFAVKLKLSHTIMQFSFKLSIFMMEVMVGADSSTECLPEAET